MRLLIFSTVFFIWAIGSPAQALTINPRVELNADPGTTVYSQIRLTNEERQSRTFYTLSENFNSKDETGNPSFTSRREGLATWVRVPASITLGPLETVDFPLAIEIPANADPGGHFAAVFFLTDPPKLDGEPQAVALSAKLGSLLLLRVNGDFVQNANILEFGTTGKQRFFTQLPIQFYYRFQNSGDDHTKPVGDIIISNLFGQTTKILIANTVDGSVLPKGIRRFTSVWTDLGGDQKQQPVIDLPKSEPMTYWQSVKYQAKHFALGRYKATLKLAFGTESLKSDHAEFVLYIIPWQLLSIVIPALLILLIVLRFIIRWYNRYIIRQAQRRQ